MKKSKLLNTLSTFLFYLSAFLFFIAFNFQDSRTSGWYQQFMPNPLGGQLRDIQFIDSLLGFAVTDSCILKTTNGGDNWNIKFSGYYILKRIKFFNSTTGYACAGYNNLFRTTNSGENWIALGLPPDLFPAEMFAISVDTIWLSDTSPLVGGMFRTTNGGASWQKLDNGVNQPWPDKIYFYNNRIGFASSLYGSHLYRTTNSGINWSMVVGTDGYNDIVFSDSLTGYKTRDSVRKTTNGGLNWIAQQRPRLNIDNSFYNFSLINKDTLWACGGTVLTSLGVRGVIYRTTNGGINWGYQIPDTININIAKYLYSNFINKRVGWEYISYGSGSIQPGGVHTTVGGNDTTFYTGIKEQIINNAIDFVLFQNYPNPFNSISNIKYKTEKTALVKIIVFDISGKEIETIVNKKQSSGIYEIKFNTARHGGLSTGIYFYSLFADGVRIDTKKMILIK